MPQWIDTSPGVVTALSDADWASALRLLEGTVMQETEMEVYRACCIIA